MKKLIMIVGAAVAALGGVQTAQAVVNPFGDALFWWRGGRDGANGCAQDGIFTQGELVDTRHAKDTTFWNQGYTTLNPNGAVDNTLVPYMSEMVTAPYACKSYSASTLYFPQTFTVTTNYTDGVATEIRLRAQQISRLYMPKIFRDSCANGTCSNYTAFIRFRRDGVTERPGLEAESIMLLDYNWGLNKGIGVNFYPTDSSHTAAKLRFSIGLSKQPYPGVTISRGQWMDLAFSVAGKIITVCWCVQNGKFGSVTYDYTLDASVDNLAMSANSLIHVGTDNNLSYDADIVYNISQGVYTQKNNALLAFRGAVAQLAFWDRALDVQEMREVFGYPRPAAMTVGVKDGGTNEYLETATSVADGTGSWDDLDPALAAGQSRTVTFTLDAAKATLPQLLRIFPASGSASGRIAVTLNGNRVADAPFDGTRTFQEFVKAKFFVAGANTLTVTRMDSGTGDILIDAMEMSGSCIVGRDSGNNDVFSHEDSANVIFDFDVACGTEANFAAGVNVRKSYDSRISITFPLDAEALRSIRGMTYLTRLVSSSAADVGFPPSRFEINGNIIKSYDENQFPCTYGYIGPFDIPLEYLQEGTNTFTFSADYIGGSTSKWRAFSFHRFEMVPVPKGSIIIFF